VWQSRTSDAWPRTERGRVYRRVISGSVTIAQAESERRNRSTFCVEREKAKASNWRPGVCAITVLYRTQQDNTAMIGPRAVTIERRECVLPMAGEPPPPPPRTHRSRSDRPLTKGVFLRAKVALKSTHTASSVSSVSPDSQVDLSKPNRPPHPLPPLPADLFRGNSTSDSVSSPAAQSTSLFFRRHCFKKYLKLAFVCAAHAVCWAHSTLSCQTAECMVASATGPSGDCVDCA
jgi:hypothetical protein